MCKMELAELVLASLHGITKHHVYKLHALRVPKYAALNQKGMVNCWIISGLFWSRNWFGGVVGGPMVKT